jgi:hypothetical protein
VELDISYEGKNIDLEYFRTENEDNIWFCGTGNNKRLENIA